MEKIPYEIGLLQPWIERYKLLIQGKLEGVRYNERYKWETIQYFQDHWSDNHDASTILKILKSSFNRESNNLWSGSHFWPYKMLCEFANNSPSNVSNMFRYLFDETKELESRLLYFEKESDVLLSSIFPNQKLSHYQDKRAMLLYLTLRYPGNYFLYKNGMFNTFCHQTGFMEMPGRGSRYEYGIIQQYLKVCREICDILIADDELIALHKSVMLDGIRFQDNFHTLTQDFIYAVTTYLKTGKKYWLYQPGKDAEIWETCFSKGIMAIGWPLGDLKGWSKNQIEEKLKSLANTDGSKKNDAAANYEFANGISPGDVIIAKKGTKKLLGYGVVDSDYFFEEEGKYYQHVRRVDWEKKGLWKLPFKLVIKTLTEITHYDSEVEPGKKFYQLLIDIMDEKREQRMPEKYNAPLNQILHGPPGTGKTYATMARAVAIIEGLTAEQLGSSYPQRADLKRQYQQYVESGHIVFTTFHQAFSYEDFVEGIKPVMAEDSPQVTYEIRPGVFRKIAVEAAFAFARENASTQAATLLDFSLAFEQLVETLEARMATAEEVSLVTKNGGRLLVDSISTQRNLVVKHPGKTNTYTVSKNRLSQLHKAFADLSEVQNIDKEFRAVIGGSNSTANWAVLNAIREQETGTTDGEPQRTINWAEKQEVVSALGSEDFQGETGTPHVLIIDEINRGNVSGIFGELITLLEGDKRLGQPEALTVTLPYSQQPFGVPPNLHIIGTMNTADRSVEALDTALRRRFAFEEVAPRPELLREGGFADLADTGIDLCALLTTINERVALLLDKDHTIGHSYFYALPTASDFEDTLLSIFYDRLIPLLEEYFYGDQGKLGLVLGRAFVRRKPGHAVKLADFPVEDAYLLQDKSIYTIIDYRTPDDGREYTFLGAVEAIYTGFEPNVM